MDQMEAHSIMWVEEILLDSGEHIDISPSLGLFCSL